MPACPLPVVFRGPETWHRQHGVGRPWGIAVPVLAWPPRGLAGAPVSTVVRRADLGSLAYPWTWPYRAGEEKASSGLRASRVRIPRSPPGGQGIVHTTRTWAG